jgi:hypothetical protein
MCMSFLSTKDAAGTALEHVVSKPAMIRDRSCLAKKTNGHGDRHARGPFGDMNAADVTHSEVALALILHLLRDIHDRYLRR